MMIRDRPVRDRPVRDRPGHRFPGHRFPWLSLPLLVGLLLSGCGGEGLQTVVAPSSGALHQVRNGQTVESIARLYFLSPEDIARANDLFAPYSLDAGQKLVIPLHRQHTVVPGDTIGELARVYGVAEKDMMALNRLDGASTIRPGQKLKIPSNTRTTFTLVRQQPVTRSVLDDASSVLSPLPTAENRHLRPDIPVLKARQRPSRFSVPRTAAQNALSTQNPAKNLMSATRIVRAPIRPKKRNRQLAPSASVAQVSAVRDASSQSSATVVAVTPSQVISSTSSIAAGGLIWPLSGKVISGFGNKTSGTRNDGINIAVAIGTGVRAAADGKVVYAGDTLSKGFGNILILRHRDNLMTAYAHNQVLLAREGQTVRQGEIIARSGQSGSVETPQLHFEIRRGTTPVNPMQYLP